MLFGMKRPTFSHAILHALLAAATLLAPIGCATGPQHEFQMHVPSEPPPEQIDRMLGEISAEKVGHYVDTLAGFGTRHTLSETESETRGIGAARRWIRNKFEQFAKASPRQGDLAPRVRMDVHHVEPDGERITKPVDIVNPILELPGADPDAAERHYYIIAHYDSRASDPTDAESRAPGANDNASGTAVVMELARVMSKHTFDSTIVFMPTAGEEQGLYGARLHLEQALADNIDIRAVLNDDAVGDPRDSFDGPMHDDQVRVFSEGVPRAENFDQQDLDRLRALSAENDSESRQLARYIAETAAWHETPVRPLLIWRPDRFLRGGDHTPFNRKGIPAVRFTVVDETYTRQHQDVRVEDGVQYGDLARYIVPEYVAGVAQINGASLAHLANAPSKPANARLIVAELTRRTTLRWQASPEPDTAGYEIVHRRTNSPVWEGAIDVGEATEATLEMNKDNHFFGVRAYDDQGHRSPVAFPTAARE